MKPVIRALLISITSLTIGAQVHAMDSTETNHARTVRHWYLIPNSYNTQKVSNFCLTNPIFQWLEYRVEFKSWDDQNIFKFWDDTRSYIWQKEKDDETKYRHRMNCFAQLICILLHKIERNNLESQMNKDQLNKDWLACVNNTFNAFTKNTNLQENEPEAARRILASIFMYDPKFSK